MPSLPPTNRPALADHADHDHDHDHDHEYMVPDTVPDTVPGIMPGIMPDGARAKSAQLRIEQKWDYPQNRFVFPRIALLVRPRFSEPAASSSAWPMPLVICRSKYLSTDSGRKRVRWAKP